MKETPPSENYMKLESLCARVVNPYLGCKGLYARCLDPKDYHHEKVTERHSAMSWTMSVGDESPETNGKASQGAPQIFCTLISIVQGDVMLGCLEWLPFESAGLLEFMIRSSSMTFMR